MKINTIIGLGLALACSFSTLAQAQENLEKHLANASEILVGTWEQQCNKSKSVLKFSANNKVKKTHRNTTHKGSWKINGKDKLVLKYDDHDKEKWQFTKFNNNKYTITKDSVTCTAKKQAKLKSHELY